MTENILQDKIFMRQKKKKTQAHLGLLGGSLESETQNKNYRLETEIPRLIRARESVLTDLHEVKLPSLTEFHPQQKWGILQTMARMNWKLNFQLSCPHSLLPCFTLSPSMPFSFSYFNILNKSL